MKKNSSAKSVLPELPDTIAKSKEPVFYSAADNIQLTDNQVFLWKKIFKILAITAFFLLPVLAWNAGNSTDEHFHIKHSENVYDFYASGGEDTSALVVTDASNMPYFAQLPDTVAHLINKSLDLDREYEIRHIINSLIGWLGMLFIGLFAFRLANWRAACIAFILAFISPRFLGHSFNNLKDIPFATSMLVGLYCIVRFLQQFPNITLKTSLQLTLGFAFALSVRIGGLLLIPYFGLFTLLFVIKAYWHAGIFSKTALLDIKKILIYSIPAFILGWLLAVLVWPFGLVSPIKHTLETFKYMANFPIQLREIFEGQSQYSAKFPWYYNPQFISITIPTAVMIGALLHIVLVRKKRKMLFWTFVLLFAFAFPLFWVIYSKIPQFGGWRHVLFCYPPLVVIAAAGFEELFSILKKKSQKIAGYIVFVTLLIHPVFFMVKNHPYEYLYFNEFEGGVKNAYGNYELDYYYHSVREASEWILKNVPREKERKVVIATYEFEQVKHFFRNDEQSFSIRYTTYDERNAIDWDYAIFVTLGISSDKLQKNMYPPGNAVHTINVEGRPICVILKRNDRSDLTGIDHLKHGNKDSALYYFNKALQVDPTDETALLNMGNVYLITQRYDSAVYVMNRYIDIDHYSPVANCFLADVYLRKKDYGTALSYVDQGLKYGDYSGLYEKKIAVYEACKAYDDLEETIFQTIDANVFKQEYMPKLIPVYQSRGMNAVQAIAKTYRVLADKFKYKQEDYARFFDKQAKEVELKLISAGQKPEPE